MGISALLLILAGVLLNALAQFALKASVNDVGVINIGIETVPVLIRLAGNLWLWLGLSCYGISVIVWILALSRVDVTIAYPMLSIGYIVNALAAQAFLGESLRTQRIIGIGIIIVGVFFLARS